MPPPRSLQRSNRTLTVFVCLMAMLTVALGGLGWQLLERDLEAERAQMQDRLELTADRAASEVLARLGRLESLATGSAPVPDGVVVMSGSSGGVNVRPQGSLLFGAGAGRIEASAPPALATAEHAEFRQGDFELASRLYEMAARSGNAPLRGAALVGLGRALRKAGRHDEALEAYRALAELGPVPVLGLPSELLAFEARCTLLAEQGRHKDLVREATTMADLLWSRRYALSAAAWSFHRDEAVRFGARSEPDDARAESLVLSHAAAWASEACREGTAAAGRRHALAFEGQPALVLCGLATGDAFDAVAAGPAYVRSLLTDQAPGTPRQATSRILERVHVALVDPERHTAAGTVDRSRPMAVRTPDATGLPWTVYASAAEPDHAASLIGGRRRLFLAAFGAVVLALAIGSYFIARSLQRERAVTALQSDFVSAVSHEFRTPLTSLRQLSEMLAAGRISGEAERAQSYAILAREGRRLDHLVESLLDFGRMEAGTHAYQVETIAVSELVTPVVTEFRSSLPAGHCSIELAMSGAAIVRVDRESMALALRNLLDNAVKYSGDQRTVRVQAAREHGSATISVSDDGIGIPLSEQGAVFGAFVRGSGARAAGVSGTGLGLALARRIVAAHGGEIRVLSEPNRGSTFTIVLPAEEPS